MFCGMFAISCIQDILHFCIIYSLPCQGECKLSRMEPDSGNLDDLQEDSNPCLIVMNSQVEDPVNEGTREGRLQQLPALRDTSNKEVSLLQMHSLPEMPTLTQDKVNYMYHFLGQH